MRGCTVCLEEMSFEVLKFRNPEPMRPEALGLKSRNFLEAQSSILEAFGFQGLRAQGEPRPISCNPWGSRSSASRHIICEN